MASGGQNMTTYLAKGFSSVFTTDASNSDNLLYINTSDTNITADMLGATTSIAFTRMNTTGAYTTGHIVWLNAANIGTPFQLVVHDSSDLYLYKRWKSSGTWTTWTKMNAGHADDATKITSTPNNTTTFLRGDNTWSNTISNEFKIVRTTTDWKTGAILTFNTTMSNTTGYSYIASYQTPTATTYNDSLVIVATGGCFIGGGEGAETIHQNVMSGSGTEDLFLCPDGSIRIYTGADSKTEKAIFDSSSQFYPAANNTGAIGISGNKWANMYATTFHGALDGNATTSTSIAVTAAAENDCVPDTDRFQAFRCTSSSTGGGDGYIWAQRWNGGNYVTQIYTEVDASYLMCYRFKKNADSTWGAWKRIPMGDGTGASGTWGISITGNSATTSKLLDSTYSWTATEVHNYMAARVLKAGDTMTGSLVISQPDDHRDYGLYGTYKYTKAATIWSMGTSYKIAADGSGLGNLYGAAYGYAGQAYIGSNTYAGGHQFLWCENGAVKVALGQNIWTAGKVTATGGYADRTNGTATYLNYGAAGLAGSAISWMTCWNGYELRAISKAEVFNLVRDNGGDGRYAKLAAHNNLTASGNEFTFASSEFSGTMWINYRTAGGTNGNIGQYNFGQGKGGSYAAVYAAKVYNAVWNDFAEYRKSDITESGRVLVSDGKGHLILSTERLQPSARVVSDTFGCSVGMSDSAKTPIGVAGRVLVYPYQPRENYKVGDALCAAPNGTADIMTREEIIQYPDRIIGIVDEVPEYEIWNQVLTAAKPGDKGGKTETHIEVNGRIWIYVR